MLPVWWVVGGSWLMLFGTVFFSKRVESLKMVSCVVDYGPLSPGIKYVELAGELVMAVINWTWHLNLQWLVIVQNSVRAEKSW